MRTTSTPTPSRRPASTPTPASTVVRWAVLVVVAAVAAGAVWLGTQDRDERGTDDRVIGRSSEGTAAGRETTGGGSEAVAPTNAAAAPTTGVVVPAGSSQTDGYPTGFPYTDLGALAVQFELAKAQIGFDYDQAVSVAALYADPADAEVFAQRARDAVALRRQQAGVPAEGEVAAPASYAVTPIAYTLEELDTDYYAVNLLSYVTLTTVDGETRDNLYAGTQLVRWDGEDWNLAAGSSADIAKLAAEGQPTAVAPDTPAYTEAGWITLDLTGGAASTTTTGGR